MSGAYVLQGLRPWLIQRISALYIALFIIYAGVELVCLQDVSYQLWRDWLFHPVNTIVVGLFVIALLLHAWIGMRDVILDYVHNTVVRMLAFILVMAVLIGSALWCTKILLMSVSM